MYPLQQIKGVAFKHLVHLGIRVAELRADARVVVPVRLDELESHVERRDDRDVIAELCFSRATGRQPV